MRNLLDEKPTMALHGRLKYAVNFVDDGDVRRKRLLDIGCGFGWFELNALARGAEQVVGTEISEAALTTIRQHLDDARLSTRVASALDLPFEDGAFDTVVSWEVLEHIPRHSEPQMFKEAARVLAPGGAFYLSTPHAALLSKLGDPAWWLIGHRHYSAQQVRRLAAGAGLRVEQLELRGGAWEVAYHLAYYAAKWLLRQRPPAEAAFRRKVDAEFTRPGFNGLFVKMTRPH
jgi:SAM-dependent methyltransferase